ncbi:MAG: AAA family ATPase [Acidimicrobiales bacterium]
MSSEVASPVLVVVTGLQGTGKSAIAETAAELLHAPVLAHDWAMSGLRPFPPAQRALDSMEPPGHGAVGWSILCALAQAQLRRGSSVVLDGMARAPDIRRCQQIADHEGARVVIVLTECTDGQVHRSRIEGRTRSIPNWYELDWTHVQRSQATWQPPDHVDLTLDAIEPLETNRRRVASLLLDVGAAPAH